MEVNIFELSIHNETIGYLSGFRNGKNILRFTPEFTNDDERATFSLVTHPNFPHVKKLLSKPWVKRQRLHPILSNLLPEGALKELLTQELKIHIDDEIQLIAALGHDLPGALTINPAEPNNIPPYLISEFKGTPTEISVSSHKKIDKFSLAGVQMKFSMKKNKDQFHLSSQDSLGNWIIKTPSQQHQQVPENEYYSMLLAKMVGVEIPEIKLVEMDNLHGIPSINLPNEKHAFAIKRFDRAGENKIHMEDFAQIFLKYPHEKYASNNYEQIAKVLYQYSSNSLGDVQQLARRILVNILLANGDAHLKNWSVIYPDKKNPKLSPAYDILTTGVYIKDEYELALNLAKNKKWFQISFEHFQQWAKTADIPWRAIKPHLKEVIAQARSEWPKHFKQLGIPTFHQLYLKEHLNNLHSDFKITV